ncbi:probable polygalacturonase isoform X1 [Malania oleifera]|uniref:probable polygalacturonase isoform X1 n=1 Tax=Malania oleifera TaxID=397392 RepID=UPI0025AE720B|nr:probable polygalacturonase isoform X1 [Malania oleifera]
MSSILVVGLLSAGVAECRLLEKTSNPLQYSAINCRKYHASLEEFGGRGDGTTSNTEVFKTAIAKLSTYEADGGALLYVPAGRWVTGSFNLTSHFTLFLDKDAVILGSTVESEWPLTPTLPSYGRGRDAAAGRYASLITGSNLTDVIITGYNGTIDGQGSWWWSKFHKKKLQYTRPYLIELLYSDQIQISNLTLVNSSSWHVHPIYCSDVIIQGLTILAPTKSPNTDGIDPDSCTNVKIEDCYIVSGDDCIAVKSGWDEYGIKFGMPTQHLIIRRLTCISPDSAVIALGSEMSGGISDVRAEDITGINSESGLRIKTAIGRGGFIKHIYLKRMTLHTMHRYVVWMAGTYGQHADENFDPNALPVVNDINIRDIVAENVTRAGSLIGIQNDTFTGICISNVHIQLNKKTKKVQWNCSDIEGVSDDVTPQPCELLPNKDMPEGCPYPTDKLPIDNVQLKTCSM